MAIEYNQSFTMKKSITLICLFVTLIACGNIRKKEERRVVEVEVMRVDSLDNIASTHYVGSVVPRREARLSSQHQGKIAEVMVSQGARVTAGQPLVRVDSHQLTSANEAAEAALRQAEDGLRRVNQVHQSGSVADVKLVEIETKVAQARAAAVASRKSLEECTIRAPFSGFVAKMDAEVGVEVGIVEELVRIVDMSEVEIEMAVPEKEINNVRIGDRAYIDVTALDVRVMAVVTEKNMIGSELSHSYKCRLKLQQRVEGLMPGMISRVFMEDANAAHRIVVPADVIRMDSEGKYLWVAVPTAGDETYTIEKRRVTLGEFVGRGAEVLSGLEYGDCVVTKGGLKVSTGMEVVVK